MRRFIPFLMAFGVLVGCGVQGEPKRPAVANEEKTPAFSKTSWPRTVDWIWSLDEKLESAREKGETAKNNLVVGVMIDEIRKTLSAQFPAKVTWAIQIERITAAGIELKDDSTTYRFVPRITPVGDKAWLLTKKAGDKVSLEAVASISLINADRATPKGIELVAGGCHFEIALRDVKIRP